MPTWPRTLTRSGDRRLLVRLAGIAGVVGVYSAYSAARIAVGRDALDGGVPEVPYRHALDVLAAERWLDLDVERAWQDAVLGQRWLVEAANVYYTHAHQPMVLLLVCIVMLRAPLGRAVRWCGALLLQLPAALVLFATYPLMPPRLMDAGPPWGGAVLQPVTGTGPFGYVDTLIAYPGFWTPDPVAVGGYTNQFAAMPSLHCGFAMWVGIVWWLYAHGRWWRFVGPLHTAVTLWVVVITGNHFVLDAVAGWAIAGGALLLTSLVRVRRAPHAHDDPAATGTTPLVA